MSAGRWTTANLTVQGYRLEPGQARALRVGLRFPTALCLVLVISALALQSAVLVIALIPIGAVAGWTSRHPFDLLWNHALRHPLGAPEVPPNPQRRRHAFKLATVMLGVLALLLAIGATAAALALGAALVATCALVTTTNYCVPSTALGWLERHRAHAASRA